MDTIIKTISLASWNTPADSNYSDTNSLYMYLIRDIKVFKELPYNPSLYSLVLKPASGTSNAIVWHATTETIDGKVHVHMYKEPSASVPHITAVTNVTHADYYNLVAVRPNFADIMLTRVKLVFVATDVEKTEMKLLLAREISDNDTIVPFIYLETSETLGSVTEMVDSNFYTTDDGGVYYKNKTGLLEGISISTGDADKAVSNTSTLDVVRSEVIQTEDATLPSITLLPDPVTLSTTMYETRQKNLFVNNSTPVVPFQIHHSSVIFDKNLTMFNRSVSVKMFRIKPDTLNAEDLAYYNANRANLPASFVERVANTDDFFGSWANVTSFNQVVSKKIDSSTISRIGMGQQMPGDIYHFDEVANEWITDKIVEGQPLYYKLEMTPLNSYYDSSVSKFTSFRGKPTVTTIKVINDIPITDDIVTNDIIDCSLTIAYESAGVNNKNVGVVFRPKAWESYSDSGRVDISARTQDGETNSIAISLNEFHAIILDADNLNMSMENSNRLAIFMVNEDAIANIGWSELGQTLKGRLLGTISDPLYDYTKVLDLQYDDVTSSWISLYKYGQYLNGLYPISIDSAITNFYKNNVSASSKKFYLVPMLMKTGTHGDSSQFNTYLYTDEIYSKVINTKRNSEHSSCIEFDASNVFQGDPSPLYDSTQDFTFQFKFRNYGLQDSVMLSKYFKWLGTGGNGHELFAYFNPYKRRVDLLNVNRRYVTENGKLSSDIFLDDQDPMYGEFLQSITTVNLHDHATTAIPGTFANGHHRFPYTCSTFDVITTDGLELDHPYNEIPYSGADPTTSREYTQLTFVITDYLYATNSIRVSKIKLTNAQFETPTSTTYALASTVVRNSYSYLNFSLATKIFKKEANPNLNDSRVPLPAGYANESTAVGRNTYMMVTLTSGSGMYPLLVNLDDDAAKINGNSTVWHKMLEQFSYYTQDNSSLYEMVNSNYISATDLPKTDGIEVLFSELIMSDVDVSNFSTDSESFEFGFGLVYSVKPYDASGAKKDNNPSWTPPSLYESYMMMGGDPMDPMSNQVNYSLYTGRGNFYQSPSKPFIGSHYLYNFRIKYDHTTNAFSIPTIVSGKFVGLDPNSTTTDTVSTSDPSFSCYYIPDTKANGYKLIPQVRIKYNRVAELGGSAVDYTMTGKIVTDNIVRIKDIDTVNGVPTSVYFGFFSARGVASTNPAYATRPSTLTFSDRWVVRWNNISKVFQNVPRSAVATYPYAKSLDISKVFISSNTPTTGVPKYACNVFVPSDGKSMTYAIGSMGTASSFSIKTALSNDSINFTPHASEINFTSDVIYNDPSWFNCKLVTANSGIPTSDNTIPFLTRTNSPVFESLEAVQIPDVVHTPLVSVPFGRHFVLHMFNRTSVKTIGVSQITDTVPDPSNV